MSLHSLCRSGLLSRETTTLFQRLFELKEVKNRKLSLFETGMFATKSHASEIAYRLRKRFSDLNGTIPDLHDLTSIACSSLNSTAKSQIYFVYLVKSDEIVQYIVQKLADFYFKNQTSPEISRQHIKTILETYLKASEIESDEKTTRNWIGRFLSAMREVNLLIPKKQNIYLVNFVGILPETVIFFALHALFHNYSLFESDFVKLLNLPPLALQQSLEDFPEDNFTIYKSDHDQHEYTNIIINSKFESIQKWAESFQ